MITRTVHVYSVLGECVLEVKGDDEQEILKSAHAIAEGRPVSEWEKASVRTVALLYVTDGTDVRRNSVPDEAEHGEQG
jgi:hypothetical protein